MSSSDVDLGIGPPPAAQMDGAELGGGDPFEPGPIGGGTVLEDGPDHGAPAVDPAVVRSILEGIGDLLAAASDEVTVPVVLEPGAPDQWRFTDDELEHLTPIITRMVNARPALRSAAARGDEIALALQLAPYLARNVLAGLFAAGERRDGEPIDTSGEPAHGHVSREAADPQAADRDGTARDAGGGHFGAGDPPVGAGIHSPAF